eukprot:6737017-Lingulodinium_polyedra.AAC.1
MGSGLLLPLLLWLRPRRAPGGPPAPASARACTMTCSLASACNRRSFHSRTWCAAAGTRSA